MSNDPVLPVSNAGRNIVIVLGAVVMLGGLGGLGYGGWVVLRRAAAPKLAAAKNHRATTATCGPSTNRREHKPQLDGCKGDAECTEGTNGHCEETMVGHAHFKNRCQYDGCTTDKDCTSSKGPCICGENGEVNRCEFGECRVDADCRSGACSPSRSFTCGYEGGSGWYCHTKDDLCTNDEDCVEPDARKRAECRYDTEKKRWACSSAECHVY